MLWTGIEWRTDGSAVARSRDLVVSLSTPGSFAFDVSVTDAFGVVAGYRYIVDVDAVPFAAIIRGPTRVAEGELVTFSATTDPLAPVDTIDWFVDGAPIGAGPDFSTSFREAGIVRVEASVRVASGAVARGSAIVIVEDLEA